MIVRARRTIPKDKLLLTREIQELYTQFKTVPLPTLNEVYSLEEFKLIMPETREDLYYLDVLLKEETGWTAPTAWEFAILTPLIEDVLKEIFGEQWVHSMVISKNYEERQLLAGIPKDGKLHLEPFELTLQHMKTLVFDSFLYVRKVRRQSS